MPGGRCSSAPLPDAHDALRNPHPAEGPKAQRNALYRQATTHLSHKIEIVNFMST